MENLNQSSLAGLTPAQREAATHRDGPLLVIAGPGSGKTRTLTARLCWLIEQGHARPEELLALTFTRKAAAEVSGRLQALLGQRARGVTVGTFHAVAALVHPPDRPVLGEGDRLALVRRAARHVGVEPRRLNEVLCRQKGNAEPGAQKGEDDRMAEGMARYEELRRALCAIDMDDILIESLSALSHQQPRWRYVSVDEYQDVNRVQRELTRALCGPDCNVFAIGDPDQAIYAFRGADVRHFLSFAEDFPRARVVTLADNFRSTATVVDAAAAVIERNRGRAAGVERARPSRENGAPIARIEAPNDGAEADAIVAEIERMIGGSSLHAHDTGRVSASSAPAYAFSDIAILSRTAARADALALALEKAGVPLQRPRRSLLGGDEALDLIAYLRLVQGVQDPGTLLRVLHREAPASLSILERAAGQEQDLAQASPLTLDLIEGPGRTNLEDELERLRALPPPERVDVLSARLGTPGEIAALLRCRAERHGEAAFVGELLSAHESDELDPRAERVSVLTLHGAKGLEFPVVFIAGCEADQLPGAGKGAEEVEEERRLFYVGLTRARDRLYLCRAGRGKRGDVPPSPFLAEIPEGLYAETHKAPPRKRKSQMSLF